MERITRFRIGIVLLLLLLVMGFYATKLYQLQVVETGGQPSDNMTTFTTLTRVKAARVDLTDRNSTARATGATPKATTWSSTILY